MSKLRVLVVEDSLTVRKHLLEILAQDPDLEVIGEAEDGKTAIELCQRLRPDVLSLDMMLPVMTGLAATEYIMAYCPTPILIVSASTNRGELYRTYDALAAGAVDVLDKPLGDETDLGWEQRYRAALKLVSKIKVITHPRARLNLPHPSPGALNFSAPNERTERIELVALGASTGGPAALVNLLRQLPPDFPLPILIVIHLGKAFAMPFAEWLDSQTRLRVTYAQDGEIVPRKGPGRVFLAPPDRHLRIQGGRLWLSNEAERFSCRPSVDVLFESVAQEFGSRAAACLLTGMGRDGASGLLAIRNRGGLTVAQDEQSSVVFGMPREAQILGAAMHMLSLEQIASMLAALPDRRHP